MDKKTKILFCITKANWGGAQRYVFELAVAAQQAGYEVVVAYGAPGILAERLSVAGVRGVPIPHLGRDVALGADWGAYRALSQLIKDERPDILHLNSSKIGGLGGLAGRLHHVPRIIFTAHGWAFNEDRSLFSKAALYVIYWLTAIFATDIIAVSNETRRQVCWFPFVQKKFTVIYNGISTDPGILSKAEALAFLSGTSDILRARIADHPFIIGTVAELHPIKGLRYLIEAAHILAERGTNFVVLVAGEGEQRAELEQEIRRYGLGSRVFLLGYVKNASTYLSAFDIFVLASLSEALAYAILEAGLAERPVVATRVGGIPEIISSDTLGLLVPPKDPQTLANACMRLMSDETLRDQLGRALREKIIHEFSLERMVQDTFALYTSRIYHPDAPGV